MGQCCGEARRTNNCQHEATGYPVGHHRSLSVS